jgi:hypothetical protein
MNRTQSLLSFILLAGALFAALFTSACSGERSDGPTGTGPIQVAIAPLFVIVELETTYQFQANVTGGQQGQQAVGWQVVDGPEYGTINSQGLYTAPVNMPASATGNPPSATAVIRATSLSDPDKVSQASVRLVPAPEWGELPVQFTVRTQDSWSASQAPTTVGIPIKAGVLSNTSSLRLRTGGTEVPAQFEVTSRWGSGNTIRWLLVDFIADIPPATGEREYELVGGGTGNATGTSLTVNETSTSVEVNTGVLEFTLSKTGFRLFESIRIDRNNNGTLSDEVLRTSDLAGVVVTEGSTDFLMDDMAPTRVEVEQDGPIRTTIVAEGVHSDPISGEKLNYICRVTAWTDLPFIKVQYSFINMEGDGVPTATAADAAAQVAAVTRVDALNIDLPFETNGQTPMVSFAGPSTVHTVNNMTAGEHAELFQTYYGQHEDGDDRNPQPPGFSGGIGSAETLVNVWPSDGRDEIGYEGAGVATFNAPGERASGWMQMTVDGLRVTANVRDFWQMYPKSLRVNHDGLMRVGIWPEQAWQLQVFAGTMRTHEVLYSIEAAATPNAGEGWLRNNIINDPPVGVLNPRHTQATKVFGEIGVTDGVLQDTMRFVPAAVPFVENYMDEVVAYRAGLQLDRINAHGGLSGHEYGFWAFGTGKGRPSSNPDEQGWVNHHWEIARACFNWHVASGNMSLFRMGDEAARHFRDVSVQHSNIGWRYAYTEVGNPAVSGGVATQLGRVRPGDANKQFHFGRYDDGETGLEHLTGGYLAEHYLMTGDRLSLDVLTKIFRYVQGTWKRHFDSGNGGTDMTMDAPSTWLSNALFITTAYEMAAGHIDSDAAAMSNYVINVIQTRQSTPKSSFDPNGAGFGTQAGDFKAWHMGHMAEALELTRWNRQQGSLDANIMSLMNWLLGQNSDVYLGWVNNRFGEFKEEPGGAPDDFGGPNLMIGAGMTGAQRQTGTWQSSAMNLLNVQTANITGVLPAEQNHETFAQYFRAGPLVLGAVSQ